jgi:hypothetical protein
MESPLFRPTAKLERIPAEPIAPHRLESFRQALALRCSRELARATVIPTSPSRLPGLIMGAAAGLGTNGAMLFVGAATRGVPKLMGAGTVASLVEQIGTVDLDSDLPTTRAARQRRATWACNRSEVAEEFPLLENAPLQATVAFPIGPPARRAAIGLSLNRTIRADIATESSLRTLVDLADRALEVHLDHVAIDADHTADIVVGDLKIDLVGHRVFFDGESIDLTCREFDVLSTLARNAGSVLSKTQLLSRVWGYELYSDNLVEVQVSSIRRKLGSGRSMIETVRGVGYVIRR